jgi:hypothetical protein
LGRVTPVVKHDGRLAEKSRKESMVAGEMVVLSAEDPVKVKPN